MVFAARLRSGIRIAAMRQDLRRWFGWNDRQAPAISFAEN
jgi:hypothetical protein